MKFKKKVLPAVLLSFFVVLFLVNNLIAEKIQNGDKIEGTVRASVGCNLEEKKSEMKYFLDTGQKMIPLDSPPSAKVGQRVSVEGKWADDDKKFICQTIKPLLLEERKKEKADFSDTTGEKKLLILPMKFSDEYYQWYPDNWSTSYIKERVFNDSDSLNSFYQEVSYGKLSLSGDVENERTMSNPSTSYDLNLAQNFGTFLCNR